MKGKIGKIKNKKPAEHEDFYCPLLSISIISQLVFVPPPSTKDASREREVPHRRRCDA